MQATKAERRAEWRSNWTLVLAGACGWRTAFVAIGLIWGGTALVLNFLFLRDCGDAPRSGVPPRRRPATD